MLPCGSLHPPPARALALDEFATPTMTLEYDSPALNGSMNVFLPILPIISNDWCPWSCARLRCVKPLATGWRGKRSSPRPSPLLPGCGKAPAPGPPVAVGSCPSPTGRQHALQHCCSSSAVHCTTQTAMFWGCPTAVHMRKGTSAALRVSVAPPGLRRHIPQRVADGGAERDVWGAVVAAGAPLRAAALPLLPACRILHNGNE
jgi:hypothetical protein